MLEKHDDDWQHLHAGGDVKRSLTVVIGDLQKENNQYRKAVESRGAGAIR